MQNFKTIAVIAVIFSLLLVFPAFGEETSTGPPLGSRDNPSYVIEIRDDTLQLVHCKWLDKTTAVCSISGGIGGMDIEWIWKDYMVLKRNPEFKKIILYLNSPGGSAFDGISLANLIEIIRNEGTNIEMYAFGKVASAAVVVFAAAGKGNRHCSAGTSFMLHDAAIFKFFALENAKAMKKQLEVLDLIKKAYVDIMERYTNLPRKNIEDKMEEETWFSAVQAREWGLVDNIMGIE